MAWWYKHKIPVIWDAVAEILNFRPARATEGIQVQPEQPSKTQFQSKNTKGAGVLHSNKVLAQHAQYPTPNPITQ